MSRTEDAHSSLFDAVIEYISSSDLLYKEMPIQYGSDVLLWAILKELIVPKLREQDRKIKELTELVDCLRNAQMKGVRYD